ncbi:MAG: 2-amino-4-hydroxy-6-hydroxymethyldihydropteridine pyrophosphokinase [Firmicutes bacterium]|nr:2-amino-4-hydroxy-6-hydroxymethyldihydropteridine pyrophosphokinase [Bacillota bacterium]
MIFLGLGSNIGKREQNINAAINDLSHHPKITVTKISSFYETAPVGYTDQPDFLNAVIAVDTTLSPQELLKTCLDVECKLGRIRGEKWGPRIIDIDLLSFNNYECQSERLILPHPRLSERGFVLVPLKEIAPNEPIYNMLTPTELIEGVNIETVRLYKCLPGEEEV